MNSFLNKKHCYQLTTERPHNMRCQSTYWQLLQNCTNSDAGKSLHQVNDLQVTWVNVIRTANCWQIVYQCLLVSLVVESVFCTISQKLTLLQCMWFPVSLWPLEVLKIKYNRSKLNTTDAISIRLISKHFTVTYKFPDDCKSERFRTAEMTLTLEVTKYHCTHWYWCHSTGNMVSYYFPL